jgi:phosphoribosyl 1,2-cyclic phosphate phosphodiesterase
VEAGRTFLTHICHEVSHAKREATLPEGVRLAYDGLKLEL